MVWESKADPRHFVEISWPPDESRRSPIHFANIGAQSTPCGYSECVAPSCILSMDALRLALPGHAEKIGPVFIEVSLEGSCRVIHCRDLQPSGLQRSSLLSRSELCCQFMSLGILLVDDSTALRRELVYATFNDSSLIVTNTISTDDSVASIREVAGACLDNQYS